MKQITWHNNHNDDENSTHTNTHTHTLTSQAIDKCGNAVAGRQGG